jgi:hypothetical protein
MTTNTNGSRRLLVNFSIVFVVGGVALILEHIAAPETPQLLASVVAPFLLIVGGALATAACVHASRQRKRSRIDRRP